MILLAWLGETTFDINAKIVSAIGGSLCIYRLDQATICISGLRRGRQTSGIGYRLPSTSLDCHAFAVSWGTIVRGIGQEIHLSVRGKKHRSGEPKMSGYWRVRVEKTFTLAV